MPTTEAEEYLKRAEECLRLAGACIAKSNRQILVFAAVHWQPLAKRLERLKAIAQELEVRGVRTPAGRDRWAPVQVARLMAN